MNEAVSTWARPNWGTAVASPFCPGRSERPIFAVFLATLYTT